VHFRRYLAVINDFDLLEADVWLDESHEIGRLMETGTKYCCLSDTMVLAVPTALTLKVNIHHSAFWTIFSGDKQFQYVTSCCVVG
jgi:hypothetical protein